MLWYTCRIPLPGTHTLTFGCVFGQPVDFGARHDGLGGHLCSATMGLLQYWKISRPCSHHIRNEMTRNVIVIVMTYIIDYRTDRVIDLFYCLPRCLRACLLPMSCALCIPGMCIRTGIRYCAGVFSSPPLRPLLTGGRVLAQSCRCPCEGLLGHGHGELSSWSRVCSDAHPAFLASASGPCHG